MIPKERPRSKPVLSLALKSSVLLTSQLQLLLHLVWIKSVKNQLMCWCSILVAELSISLWLESMTRLLRFWQSMVTPIWVVKTSTTLSLTGAVNSSSKSMMSMWRSIQELCVVSAQLVRTQKLFSQTHLRWKLNVTLLLKVRTSLKACPKPSLKT